MAESISYIPLTDSKRDTRMLALTGTNPLKGSLQAVSLSGKLSSYTALSYTWKDPLPPSDTEQPDAEKLNHIDIDGQQLLITPNLRDALNHLYEEKKLLLWIDAICIDQSNIRERSDQVGQMRKIYSRADQVVVWLGTRTEDSDLAMDHLALLARHANRKDRVEWLSSLGDPQYLDSWKAFQNLHRRSWWKRAWVIQEVALAQSFEVACGSRRLSECQLMQAQKVLTEGWYSIFHTDLIQSIRLTSRDFEPMLNLLRMRIHFQQGKVLGQLPILSLTRESNASDPRDYIFAKYGLMGKTALSLYAPDYTVPFEIVCKEFAWAYIQSNKDLSILCYAGISSGDQKSSIPTWVPHWGSFKPVYPLKCSWSGQVTDWPRYNAAKNTSPSIRLLEDGRVLEAEGILIDSIDGVQFDPWGLKSSDQKAGSQSKSNASAFRTEDEAFEALWRTVVADTHRQEAPLGPVQAGSEIGMVFAKACHDSDLLLEELDEAPGYIPFVARQGASNIEKRWHGMRHLKLGGKCLRDIVREPYQMAPDHIRQRQRSEIQLWGGFEHSFGQAMYHRRLFTTNGGYLGIGPRTLTPGDRICVLHGCTQPLVIRITEKNGQYRLVGECYIHGFMNGEAVDGVEDGKRVSRIRLC